MVVRLRGEAATARHLAVARAGLTRERRRMKEHAWKAKPSERHRATPKHVNVYAISELALQNDSSVCVCKPRCSPRFSLTYHSPITIDSLTYRV